MIAVLTGRVSQPPNTQQLINQASAARLQHDYGNEENLRSAIDKAALEPKERDILLNNLILIVDLSPEGQSRLDRSVL